MNTQHEKSGIFSSFMNYGLCGGILAGLAMQDLAQGMAIGLSVSTVCGKTLEMIADRQLRKKWHKQSEQ